MHLKILLHICNCHIYYLKMFLLYFYASTGILFGVTNAYCILKEPREDIKILAMIGLLLSTHQFGDDDIMNQSENKAFNFFLLV